MKQNNFLLMVGQSYYPCGDKDFFDTLFYKSKEAEAVGQRHIEVGLATWYRVIDVRSLNVVAQSGSYYGGDWEERPSYEDLEKEENKEKAKAYKQLDHLEAKRRMENKVLDFLGLEGDVQSLKLICDGEKEPYVEYKEYIEGTSDTETKTKLLSELLSDEEE